MSLGCGLGLMGERSCRAFLRGGVILPCFANCEGGVASVVSACRSGVALIERSF